MASPNLELSAIIDRLTNQSKSLVAAIRDEIVTGRATGVPDEVTIQRLVEQRQREIGNVNRISKGFVDSTIGRLRQAYLSTHAEGAAAMENPETFDTVLPEDEGHQYMTNDLGQKVANLGDNASLLRLQAAQQRAAISNQKAALTGTMTEQSQDTRNQVDMIWIAAFRNSCADCINLAGQTKTLGDWKESGFFPGNGNTRCGENCQCHLAPVNRLADRFGLPPTEEGQSQLASMLSNGVQLQKKKIEELEKIRGAKYAPSTREQLLGQIRDPRFNPDSQSKESVFIKGSTDNRLKKFINEQKD